MRRLSVRGNPSRATCRPSSSPPLDFCHRRCLHSHVALLRRRSSSTPLLTATSSRAAALLQPAAVSGLPIPLLGTGRTARRGRGKRCTRGRWGWPGRENSSNRTPP